MNYFWQNWGKGAKISAGCGLLAVLNLLGVFVFICTPVMGYLLYDKRRRFGWGAVDYACLALMVMRVGVMVGAGIHAASDAHHPANVRDLHRELGVLSIFAWDDDLNEGLIRDSMESNRKRMTKAWMSVNGDPQTLPVDVYAQGSERALVKVLRQDGKTIYYSVGPDRIDDRGKAYDPANGIGSRGDLILGMRHD
jgi:hypothetical protein